MQKQVLYVIYSYHGKVTLCYPFLLDIYHCDVSYLVQLSASCYCLVGLIENQDLEFNLHRGNNTRALAVKNHLQPLIVHFSRF